MFAALIDFIDSLPEFGFDLDRMNECAIGACNLQAVIGWESCNLVAMHSSRGVSCSASMKFSLVRTGHSSALRVDGRSNSMQANRCGHIRLERR